MAKREEPRKSKLKEKLRSAVAALQLKHWRRNVLNKYPNRMPPLQGDTYWAPEGFNPFHGNKILFRGKPGTRFHGSQIAYDPKSFRLVRRGPHQGTYDYVSPLPKSKHPLLYYPEQGARLAGHVAVDILPHLVSQSYDDFMGEIVPGVYRGAKKTKEELEKELQELL